MRISDWSSDVCSSDLHDGAVVFEHQNALVAEVLDEALAFLLAHRHALEIMVGELAGEVAGVEIDRLEPDLERADSHRRGGVRVDDRMRVGQDAVEQDVLAEARLVDVPRSEGRREGKEG